MYFKNMILVCNIMDSWEGILELVGINNVKLKPEIRQEVLGKWTLGKRLGRYLKDTIQ